MIQEIRLDELDITLDYYYRTKDKPKYLNKLIFFINNFEDFIENMR